MNKTEESLSGVHYVFYGPNATLIHWIKNSELARMVMDASGLELETLFRAFSKNNPEDGMRAGKEAIKALWHAWPELGPYPFLDTLSDFEFNREFYPDYREHVNHQLRVFWLGLYLLEMCFPIRERVLAEIGAGDEAAGTTEFLRRWCACAVYHDIGYVVECDGANEPGGEAWNRVCQVVNDTLHAPLSGLPMFSERLGVDAEHSAIEDLEIFRPKIKTLRAIEKQKGSDLLDRIADYGTGAGLGKSEGRSPFRRYYDYAMSHKPMGGKRPAFRDHGIGSAMLLMKIWSDFSDYVGKASAAAESHHLFQGIAGDVLALKERLTDAENSILAASGAIALHNITPSSWDKADTLEYGLTLHTHFQIRFHEDGLKPPLAPSPMAFLLGLADTLQTWDRPRFRAMRTHDTPGLSDQDMDLGVEDGKIFLFFKEDEEYRHPESNKKSRFSKTCENLKEYLDNRAIDDLLQCGEWVIADEAPESSEPEMPKSEPPRPPAFPKVQIAKLPVTGEELFGREKELKTLDEAWKDPNTTILTLVAFGGVGKTSLVNRWLNRMGRDKFRGAGRVYGWSFYSQGAKEGTQASADEFFAQALEWFGDPDPEKGSPWDRGLRLAELVRESRALLILDGLEPIQYPPGPMQGRLKDQGLQALTRELRQFNPGLLVITTRIAVEDIADAATVKRIDLENLSEHAGGRLLEKLGAKGNPDELNAAVREFGGHALALNLLGRFISVVHEGDIRKRDRIEDLTEEIKHGGHARRVMASYDTWLSGTPEHDILHLMGLFDRPAAGGAIRALREPPALPGLTDKLENLSETQWQFALQHLRDLRLLAKKDDHRPDTLDCHPLVRVHFGEKLRREKPDAWKQAHSRLYEYFRELPEKELPDTLEEMAPLFAAVAHGCLAGRYQEAFDNVYWGRISRKNDFYSTDKLGAFGADLSALSNFFEQIWNKPSDDLRDKVKAIAFNLAGFRLRAIGRLRESVQPMQAALDNFTKLEDWKNAANEAANLNQLLLTLGNVARAVEYGRQGVEFADQSGDRFQKVGNRTILADALHQQGDLSAAETLFIKAETQHKEMQPHLPYLYPVGDYLYCDLLLSRGRHAEAKERAEETIGIAFRNGWLLPIALDNLSIGRSFLLQAVTEKTGEDTFDKAGEYLDRSVEGLRLSGDLSYLPHGLLARAHLHRVTHNFAKSHADLEEIRELSERSEMKLFLADYHLESARLARDRLVNEGGPDLKTDMQTKFETHVREARKLIEETGYGRRKGELAELEG